MPPARSFVLPALTAAAGLFVALWTLLPVPSAWVDHYYSRGLYRALAALLVPLSDLVPLSLSGLALTLAPALLALLMLRGWRRRKSAREWLLRWSKHLLGGLLGLYVLFLVLWGLNYGRPPLEARLGLELEAPNIEEVAHFAGGLAAIIWETAPPEGTRDRARALASLRAAIRSLVLDWEGRQVTLPSRVKTTPAGLLLLNNTAGVVSPFFLEAHVDGGLPEYKFLAVAAHELSHLAGYGGEADTDFIAAVAGLRAGDPYARYSVALSLFEGFARRLPADLRGDLVEGLPEAARRDLEAARAVRLRYRNAGLQRLQGALYDSYLRAQGVSAGVADYGRVVELLLAAERRGLRVLGPPETLAVSEAPSPP
ncbi:MAG: DUF3810 domain-containing protein [Deinococcota bacterium]|nr:DUF3810 domain-containing protein [Deinococcota bacterium]